MHDTISCLLCHGVVGFTQDDPSRYENHLSLEHRVFYSIPWIISKTVQEFDKISDKKPYLSSAVAERENDPNVSVSITNLATGELVSMVDANDEDGVKEEVNNILDNMNTEEFLEEDAVEVISDDPLDENPDQNETIDEQGNGGKFKCEDCDTTVKTKKKLLKHIKTTHTAGKPKPYQCSICQKSFKTKSYVETHEKNHGEGAVIGKEEKPFPCDMCGKSFKTEWYMKTHQKSHTVA